MSNPIPRIASDEIHCPVCTYGGSVVPDENGARVWHAGRDYPCRVPAILVESTVAEWDRIRERASA